MEIFYCKNELNLYFTYFHIPLITCVMLRIPIKHSENSSVYEEKKNDFVAHRENFIIYSGTMCAKKQFYSYCD